MLVWICAVALQAAAAQDAAAPAPQAAAAAEPALTLLEEVLVEGARPNARLEIDRRTYRVTDAPQVQTSSTLELLSQIPSVTVTPAGRVQLLGNPGVTILVDGRPPVSADATLRTLPAGQVDRVEVMTNPSAQFSAQGVAGIINIVTVKRPAPGWTGTVSSSVTSLGAGQLAFSPSLSRDAWTFEGSLSVARQRGENANRLSRFLGSMGDPGQEFSLTDDIENREDRARVSSRIRYRVSPQDSVSLSAEALTRRNLRLTRAEATGREAFTELSEAPDRSTGASAALDFERTGPIEGETLKASASVDYLDWTLQSRALVEYNDPSIDDSRFETANAIRNDGVTAKADYVRPIGANWTLTTGGSWTRSDERTSQSLAILQGSGPGPASQSDLDSVRRLAALYGTIQFPLAGWTVRPGLRIEHDDFEVRTTGLWTQRDDVSVFPSLHLRRKLTDDLSMNLSFSRRINRPDAQRLNPYIVFDSSSSARSGNPDLEPEFTNAFEARFEYAGEGFSLDATLYNRETSNTWAETTRLLDDVIFLTTSLNAGTRSERGAEFSARGRLGSQWKYVASTNLFLSQQDALEDGLLRSRDDFSYTVTSQLEYRIPTAEGELPDEFQVSLRHFGPRFFYDRRTSSFTQLDVTWRHPLRENLSFVTTITDLLNSAETRTRFSDGNLSERSEHRGAGTTVRAALVYRFQ